MDLSLSSNSRFFGMDLSQWPRQWRAAGDLLFELPLMRELSPAVTVQLHQADGGVSHWRLQRGVATPLAKAPESARTPVVQAVELPADAVLERALTLPRLGAAELAQAAALEAAAISPFPADQTVAGFSQEPAGEDTTRVHLALTSRQQVQARLQALGQTDREASEGPEVWVLPTAAGSQALRPIVLHGFGEARREQLVARGRLYRLAMIGLALLLLVALLCTPTIQLRAKALQAQRSMDALTAQAQPVVAQREALVQQADHLRAVAEVAKTQMAPLPVLAMLTRALPDTAWITSLRIDGEKATIMGNGDDAAALVQRLGREPGVREVRLPTPATRSGGRSKEFFTIEMQLDPAVYGLTRTVGGAA